MIVALLGQNCRHAKSQPSTECHMLSGHGAPLGQQYAGCADIEWVVLLEEVFGTRSPQDEQPALKTLASS
jgi:hypothetical protein